MARPLKFRFDSELDYQIDAINSVVDLFAGIAGRRLGDIRQEDQLSFDIVPNWGNALFNWGTVEDNFRDIQNRNHIEPSNVMEEIDGMVFKDNTSHSHPSFTIEMETGTGKTYVYLRTIMELYHHYGFTKFIVVVPSVAILEGVIKTLEITKNHFRSLYDNTPLDWWRYERSKLPRIKQFAQATTPTVMIMTIDSFNKKSNTIYKEAENFTDGRLPYQCLQATRPIVILDEPQKMEGEASQKAIRTLHPLFSLRYSATHRIRTNLVYRLTPFEAFRRGLVKRIQITGIFQESGITNGELSLASIEYRSGSKTPHALIRVNTLEEGQTKEVTLEISQHDDLLNKTHNPLYTDNYIVDEIDVRTQTLTFRNGLVITIQDMGMQREQVFRIMIRKTLEHHVEAQLKLAKFEIKVLSLFFIDRVANYIGDDAILPKLFDEEYQKIRHRLPQFAQNDPSAVRRHYFAKRQGMAIDTQIDEDHKNKNDKEAEKESYTLIMKDKERLLSFDESTCIIFAHSALREGWDNPNVFQICTLHQTQSEFRRRQEIGRGLRICVNQKGERVFGDEANILTIVANESYENYAAKLQREYREDTFAEGDIPQKPTKAGYAEARRNENLYMDEDFRHFWEALSRKIKYRISFDTDTFIERCLEDLNNTRFPDAYIASSSAKLIEWKYMVTLVGFHGNSVAEIRVSGEASDGYSLNEHTRHMLKKHRLSSHLNDSHPEIRAWELTEIDPYEGLIKFANGEQLIKNVPREINVHKVNQIQTKQVEKLEQQVAIPADFIRRAADVTHLTRKTLFIIFSRLAERQKKRLVDNPEGFINHFIEITRQLLAITIAESLKFTFVDRSDREIEQHFPATKNFVQQELIPAGSNSLYNFVQIDSDTERLFVDKYLRDQPEVLLYFKFPPTYLIDFPHIIGKYNPDWGIIRKDNEEVKFYLVRETKGTAKLEKLRFSHEEPKILSAYKFFETLIIDSKRGRIDYRHIGPETMDEWRKSWNPKDQLILNQ